MASACRAAAAALVKSFPPAVAAPFCMLVGDVLLHQHAGYRGIGCRKNFRRARARRAAAPRHTGQKWPLYGNSLPYSLPYSPRAPIQPAVLQRPSQALTCLTRQHAVATARLRPVYGSSRQRPGENFSAEPPQRGGSLRRAAATMVHGRAFPPPNHPTRFCQNLVM